MGSHIFTSKMKGLLIATLLAMASARPRYLVIDLDAVEGPRPMDLLPRLARQARMAQNEEDNYQSAPLYDQYEPRDSQGSSSNAYAPPAPQAGPDHVDYGAYTGGYGAFGWSLTTLPFSLDT